MADVFLSYASDDRNLAAPIAESLAAAGLSVWWDQNIEAGTDWDKSIEWELEKCGVVVCLFTPTSVDSRWVRAEAMFGLEHDKLVPLILDEVRMPVIFHTVQGVSWKGDTMPILNAVQSKLSSVTPIPSTITPEKAPKNRRWAYGSLIFSVLFISTLLLYTILRSPDQSIESSPNEENRLTVLIAQANALTGEARIERYLSLVNEHPDEARIWTALGRSYAAFDQTDLALNAVKRAIALDPKQVSAQILMGGITTGPEKLRHYEEALRLDPRATAALARLAFYHGAAGDVEKSEEYYEQALAIGRDDAATHRAYARLLEGIKGRFNQALAHMDRATEIDGDIGFRAPFYDHAGDFLKGRRAIYNYFIAAPGGIAAVNLALRFDPETSLRWLDVAEKLGGPPTRIAEGRIAAYANLHEPDKSKAVISKYESEYADQRPLDTFLYQFEAAAHSESIEDHVVAQTRRERTLEDLKIRLERFRTIKGYRIASVDEIHFGETLYHYLLLTAWSLNDHKLTRELADALVSYWAVPRITNLGPGSKHFQLATIAAVRGDNESALAELEQAFQGGADPAAFELCAHRFDVRGEWSEMIRDPRYVDLVERHQATRLRIRRQVEREMPQLLSPDLETLLAQTAN